MGRVARASRRYWGDRRPIATALAGGSVSWVAGWRGARRINYPVPDECELAIGGEVVCCVVCAARDGFTVESEKVQCILVIFSTHS